MDASSATMPDADAGADAADGSAASDAPGGDDDGGCPTTEPTTGPCETNGLVCWYPNYFCRCSNQECSGGCCPITCEQLGFPCGVSGDGCGGELHCRACPAGQACGANGACAGPADAGGDAAGDAGGCVPAGCPAGACGMTDDGCGGQIDCGECFWQCQIGMM